MGFGPELSVYVDHTDRWGLQCDLASAIETTYPNTSPTTEMLQIPTPSVGHIIC